MRNTITASPDNQNTKQFWAMLFGTAAGTAALLCLGAFTGTVNWTMLAGGVFFFSAALCMYRYIHNKKVFTADGSNAVVVFLLAGFLLRVLLAALTYGYTSDIACFTGWAYSLFHGGFENFYTSGQFADYPPLYMYVLWAMGALGNALQVTASSFIIKLPAIICDCAAAYLLYRAACGKNALKPGSTAPSLSRAFPVLLYASVILNPALIMNSAVWGQVDIFHTLLAILCVLLLTNKNIAMALVVFMLALLLKVQSALIAPVFLLSVLDGLLCKDTRKHTAMQLLYGIVAAAAVGLLLVAPFNGGRPYTWIVDQYLAGLTQYPFVTVNGFNLYGLMGLNWMPVDTTALGLAFSTWGIIGEAAVLAYAVWLYIKQPKNGKNLYALLAFIVLGVYMFGPGMHERYLFTAPMLLLFAWLHERDSRIYYAALATSAALLANECVALQYDMQWIPYPIMGTVSLFNVAAFVYTAVVISQLSAYKNRISRKVGNEA